MQYLGGKSQTARVIADLLTPADPTARVFIPFAGGLSDSAAIAKLLGPSAVSRLKVSDAAKPLVDLYSALRAGWEPDPVGEDNYQSFKIRAKAGDFSPQVVWAGIACSFGGKWMAGLARNSRGDSYHDRALRSIRRKLASLGDTPIECRDFREISPQAGDRAYLDPPYAGSTGYPIAPTWGPRDTEDLWAWASAAAARGCKVLVSEYAAPEGWIGSPLAKSRLSVSRGGMARQDMLWTKEET